MTATLNNLGCKLNVPVWFYGSILKNDDDNHKMTIQMSQIVVFKKVYCDIQLV